MKYILVANKDWADEFDLPFGEIIEEEEYLKYEYAKNVLGELSDSYWFGTNEGWEDGFDYLNFVYKPISEQEVEVLKKFGLPNGYGIYHDFIDTLSNVVDFDLAIPYIYMESLSLDQFKYYVDKLRDYYETEASSQDS